MEIDLPIELRPEELIELLVADLSLARALYAGIPTARLLARLRLGADQGDLDRPPPSRPTASSWDQLITRLLAGSGDATMERVKRAVARHARAATDEGPLEASEPTVAALVLAVCAEGDADASPAEAEGAEVAPELARACAAYDPRLIAEDRRAPLFEACVRLATTATAGPWACDRFLEAARRLSSSELRMDILRGSSAHLFPIDLEPEVPRGVRRMALLERAELDALLARDPRELASAVARIERASKPDWERSLYLDQLLADLCKLLGAGTGALLLATVHPHLPIEELVPASIPSVKPVSWMPTSWTSPDAARVLAEALERGTTTLPRLRGVILRGGDPALDAIGAEMLKVASHPFASAAFAEVLARTGRVRDVMRLVTYFAVAPDPGRAAAALGQCSAPELPSVLTAWLTSMLPTEGLAPPGEDPATSSAARLSACVAALRPYPNLYGAVRPLLARVPEAAAPASG
jgi:hypothetical protein